MRTRRLSAVLPSLSLLSNITIFTIGVARILSGVHFFGKKVDDLFFVVALSNAVVTSEIKLK